MGRGSKLFNHLPLLLVHAIGYQHFIDWKDSCMYKCSKYKCFHFFSSKNIGRGGVQNITNMKYVPPPPHTHTSPTAANSWKHKGIQLSYYKAIVFDPSFLYKETNSHSQSWGNGWEKGQNIMNISLKIPSSRQKIMGSGVGLKPFKFPRNLI